MTTVIRITLLYLQTALIKAGPGVTPQNASKQHIGSEVNLCTGYCDVDRLSVKANTIRTEKRCVALQLCR